MEKEKQIAMIREAGLIAIMRAKTSEDLIEAAKAVPGPPNTLKTGFFSGPALSWIRKPHVPPYWQVPNLS
jgi:hypothetical protein